MKVIDHLVSLERLVKSASTYPGMGMGSYQNMLPKLIGGGLGGRAAPGMPPVGGVQPTTAPVGQGAPVAGGIMGSNTNMLKPNMGLMRGMTGGGAAGLGSNMGMKFRGR
jgi:hypothetical protein